MHLLIRPPIQRPQAGDGAVGEGSAVDVGVFLLAVFSRQATLTREHEQDRSENEQER
jgi:hypothetical protein